MLTTTRVEFIFFNLLSSSGICKIYNIYKYNLCKLKMHILETTKHYIFFKKNVYPIYMLNTLEWLLIEEKENEVGIRRKGEEIIK